MNSRYGHACVLMIASTLLAACSSTTMTMSAPAISGTTAPYFIDNRATVVDIDYIDRYACADGRPIFCERTSRMTSTAVCKCII